MESQKRLMVTFETHGFTVPKHLNWVDEGYVAITPVGSIVIFRDKTDWSLYAVFNPAKGRYHIHIPYSRVLMMDERAGKVLEEVYQCLHLAECYIEKGMVYNINRFRVRGFIPFGTGRHITPLNK